MARAADAAAAAAARLDGLEVAERSARKKREGKKSKSKHVINRERTSYSPRSRASLAFYAQTNAALKDDDDDDEDEDDKANAGMPALDGSDEEADTTDGEDSDVGHVTPDEKNDDKDAADGVIRTPGPLEEPNTDDRAFIKRSSESDSGFKTEALRRGRVCCV